MAKLDIQPLDIQPLDIEPLDIQPIKKKTKWKDDLAISFAGVGNTVDTALSLGAGALAGKFGKPGEADNIYKNMDERIKTRNKWANPENAEQTFGGKALGMVGTLPMQLLSFPLSPFETGKTAIDQGESLRRAQAMTGIDTLGNLAGVAAPGAVGGKLLTKATTGAGINAAQDVATRSAIASVAEQQGTKDILGPSVESAGLSALLGGALGTTVPSKNKPAKATSKPSERVSDTVASMKKPKDIALEPVAPQETLLATQDGQVFRPEDQMWKDRAQQMQIDALKPIDDAQVELLQQGLGEQADNVRAQREAAMEQEVARQRSLDFNAAERARQEQASSGYQAWVEGQRASAEQRQPGNNAPIDFAQPYPVQTQDYPNVLQDAPYQYEGGIDFDAASPKSLPIEVADMLRTGETTPDPFNRYSPNQAARRILEKGEKPPIIKGIRRGGRQSGALDATVFEGGFRGINKFLSKLTDQPWVKQAFPSRMFESNEDGTPKILLHGTREAFDDQPRGVSYEGLHAGYAAPATLKAGKGKVPGRVDYRVGNVKFEFNDEGNGPAMYPVVIRKGNYPYLPSDYGTWEPKMLAVKREFALDLAKATGKGYYDVSDAMSSFYDSVKNRSDLTPAEENAIFAKVLKEQLGVDGFWYPNTYESTKAKLNSYFGEMPNPKRGREYASKLQHDKSFVTYDDNNMQSLYSNRGGTLRSPGNKQSGQLRVQDIAEGIANFRKKFGSVPDTVKSPISQENIEAKRKLVQKAKAATDILNTALPEWAGPTTFEETVALSKDAKDIKSNPYTRGLASGINFMSAYHNNPLLKYTRKLLADARGEMTAFSKTYITADDGVGALATKLSDESKVLINQTITELDKQQVDFTPELGAKLGMTPQEIAFMESFQRATNAEWEWRKSITNSQGVNTARKRAGYAPGIFDGSYASLVLDKDKNPIGFLGVDTPGEFMLAKKYYEEKNPGATFSANTWQKARKGFSGGQNSAFKYRDLGQMIDLLVKADGDFAKVQMQVSADAVRAAVDLFDFSVHNKVKKGIEGNLGNKGWLSPEKNASQRLDSIVRFLEEAAEHHALQKASEELRLLSADESTKHLVNTKEYIDDYFKNISGQYVHNGGKIINAAFDSVHLGVEAVAAHIPGARNYIGPNNTLKLSNTVKNKMAQMYMGWFNFMFLASQLAQPAQTGLPIMQLVANRIGDPNVSPMKSMAKGLSQYIRMQSAEIGLLEADATTNKIIEWGRMRGILDFTELERAYEGHKTKVGRVSDQLGELTMQLGESMTRPPMFLAFVDMLSQVDSNLDTVLPMAEHLTNQAMADYHKWERPMVYNGFGVLSPHIGGLTTFKHNFAGTQVLLGKEAGKDGMTSKAPLAISVMSMLAFAGITGLPFYEEFNTIYKELREKFSGERRSISQDALKELPQWAKTGIVSSLLELNMQGKFSSANMIPDYDKPGAAFFPHLSGAGTIAMDAAKFAANPNDITGANFLTSSVPSGFKQAANAAVKKDGPWLKDKFGKNDVQRTPEEWKRSILTGLVPLDEAAQRTRLFQNRENEKARMEKMTSLSAKFKEAVIANASQKEIADILNKYQEQGGNVPSLLQQIPTIQRDAQMSAEERARGIPKTQQGIRRNEAYNN